jgi:hypothetical protein
MCDRFAVEPSAPVKDDPASRRVGFMIEQVFA